MFAKLLTLILAASLTAAALLTIRQQRIQAGHDMIAAFDRARAQEEQLWQVRTAVAARITPGEVRRMAEHLGPLHPIPYDWCPPLLTIDPALPADAHDRLAWADEGPPPPP